jgi:hypothetical protein
MHVVLCLSCHQLYPFYLQKALTTVSNIEKQIPDCGHPHAHRTQPLFSRCAELDVVFLGGKT